MELRADNDSISVIFNILLQGSDNGIQMKLQCLAPFVVT